MKFPRLAGALLVFGAGSLAALLALPATGQPPATPPPAGEVGRPGYSAPLALPAGADGHGAKEQELERRARDLARQYGRAQGREEKEKLRDELAAALQQQFDAQQQRRKAEVDRVEEQLRRLREVLQKRDDAKRAIVQRRLEQLLQDAEGLGWTDSGTTPDGLALPTSIRPAPGGPVPHGI
jgi:hypothetical protein